MVLFSGLPAGWVPAGLGIWMEGQDSVLCLVGVGVGWQWGVSSPGWEGSFPICPADKSWSLGLGTSWHWDQSISRILLLLAVFNHLTLSENEC